MEATSAVIAPGVVLSSAVFDAPRARVFEAWLDSGTLARWWGPRGFTNAFEVHEPKTGGQWRFVMRGPDGREFKQHSVYVEVTPHERMVIHHVSGPVYVATITFEDLGAQTKLTWRAEFENAAFLAHNEAVVVSGNRDNLEKLAALL